MKWGKRLNENKLRSILKDGGWASGVLVSTGDEQVTELLSICGFDYIFIDSEHGNMSVQDCERLVRSASLFGATPIIRPPVNRPEWILRSLDAGAQGVVIPQVETAVDVERAVEAAYYAPLGRRGLAGSRAAQYGLAGPLNDYTVEANRENMVIAMIETATAVDNLAEILRVNGLSAIYIGPSDLSQSLGHTAQTNHPKVRAAIAEVIEHSTNEGVPVGLHVGNAADAQHAIDIGVQLVSTGAWGLLTSAAHTFLRELNTD